MEDDIINGCGWDDECCFVLWGPRVALDGFTKYSLNGGELSWLLFEPLSFLERDEKLFGVGKGLSELLELWDIFYAPNDY